MKYVEEINIGDCFVLNESHFIVTSDFKKDGKRLCIDLKTGFGIWIDPEESVKEIDIFTLDTNSNIIPIRERKQENPIYLENNQRIR